MKKAFPFLLFLLISNFSFAQDSENDQISEEEYIRKIDSINNAFTYQEGKITLQDGIAEITIPDGYKFLDAKQSSYVLTDLWGNPPSEVLGMLFPKDVNPLGDNFTYAVEVTYSKDGYINDEDAKELDYDELLEQMQEDTDASNPERKKLGYPTMDLVGWASAPFYDENNKKLHWAKEISFEGEAENTLNYNIRVLGRKGYLNLNAIGTIDILPNFKKDVNQILNSVAFTEGNKYSDFNPDIDQVAAYGIGGLIAGKLLAKAGFFVVILKFWKVIAIAVAGGFAAFKNKLFGRKEEEEVS
ncbi:putative membrane-anchored protein [Tenacibaculum adriaticum]|uniref:Putative membrane-anchored protein n=1 Tax=Tenacibaculum adriaticum TaxID=413713 RepID=A0A5S5DV83_9FLAO|nr:DUF2167 domain-containing protein [Tenacibaculum adriaticum]TYP99837.1 putative membrane-anchored protein [Tenacibaculum adriaticum]